MEGADRSDGGDTHVEAAMVRMRANEVEVGMGSCVADQVKDAYARASRASTGRMPPHLAAFALRRSRRAGMARKYGTTEGALRTACNACGRKGPYLWSTKYDPATMRWRFAYARRLREATGAAWLAPSN